MVTVLFNRKRIKAREVKDYFVKWGYHYTLYNDGNSYYATESDGTDEVVFFGNYENEEQAIREFMEYMELKENTVYNEYGIDIDYRTAVTMMDAEIMEDLHNELAPCTDQEFFDEYAKAYEEKFGEVWELAKPNPCY